MIISFSKQKEYLNGKEYFIGTTFTKIYNQMSSLTYNNSFILNSYKNADFFEYQYKVIKELKIEKILSFLDYSDEKININNSSLLKTNIEIEGMNLTYNDFKDLLFFILQLDEFIRIANTDKRLKKPKKFLYFFTVIYHYEFPKPSIVDNELLNKYEISLKENFHRDKKNNKEYNINEHYNSILKNDEKILREIGKSNNIIYEYNCQNFIQVLLVTYFYILEQKLALKQCNNCGRFFIPRNANQEFCDNIRPQYVNETDEEYLKKKMTCREYNKKSLSYKNLGDVKKTIRRIKARITKRIKRGIESEEYLNEWEAKILEYRKKYIIDEAYINWLNNESDINQIRRKKNGNSRTNQKQKI